MIKIIAILLSNLVLLQSLHIDFKDINKISILLTHAQFHEEKYGEGLGQFLFEHYVDQDADKNQNHKEHQDLPFKQGIYHFNHLVSIVDFHHFFIESKTSIDCHSKKNFLYKESYSESVKQAIFQPPKLA